MNVAIDIEGVSLPSTQACLVVVLAGLVLGYAWSAVLQRLSGRPDAGAPGPARRWIWWSLVAGLALEGLGYLIMTTMDDTAPGQPALSFAIAMAIAGGATIGLGAAATLLTTTTEGSADGRAAAALQGTRSYTSGLVTSGFCMIFIAGGIALASFATNLPG